MRTKNVSRGNPNQNPANPQQKGEQIEVGRGGYAINTEEYIQREMQRPLLSDNSNHSSNSPSPHHSINGPPPTGAGLDRRISGSGDYFGNSSSNLSTNSSNVERIRRALHGHVNTRTMTDEHGDAANTRTISAFQQYPEQNRCADICANLKFKHRPVQTDGDDDGPINPNTQDDSDMYSPLDSNRRPEPNTINTGRYNLLTFFPQSLFEQFRRLANVYFLVLGSSLLFCGSLCMNFTVC
jgi:hypothetical protein